MTIYIYIKTKKRVTIVETGKSAGLVYRWALRRETGEVMSSEAAAAAAAAAAVAQLGAARRKDRYTTICCCLSRKMAFFR